MSREHTITIKISDDELHELDKRRKEMNRSSYIRKMLFSPISQHDKDILNHAVYTSLLLRYMATDLKLDDLVFKAKEKAEAWMNENYDK